MVLGSIRRHYFAAKILPIRKRETAKENKIFETLVMCWVDVKTQLPEIIADIDVWHDGMRTTDAFFDGKQFIWIDSGGYYEVLRGVTHWRYPPAPPSSGKKSESACKEK